MANFTSINQPQTGGTPEFIQEAPISDGTATTVSQIASVGSSLFTSAAEAIDTRRKAKAATAESQAVGGLTSTLLKIRQAGETSNIDVAREQRKAMMAFNVDFPHLRAEGGKAFKEHTGVAPAQASLEEVAEQKLAIEAIDAGFGRHNATEDYNTEQREIYIQMKRTDKVNTAIIQDAQVRKTRGELAQTEADRVIMASIRDMSGISYRKYASDAQQWILDAQSGEPNAKESALFDIKRARIDVSRAVASFGEYSSRDATQAYIAPILMELQLAEDAVNGVVKQEAINSTIATNKAIAQAIFFGDPDNLDLAVLSNIFGNTVGFSNVMTQQAYSFLQDGVTRRKMVGGKEKLTRQPDVTTLEDGGRKGIKGTINNALNDEANKEDAANILAGVAEHLNRNGGDYDSEDKDFVIELLSMPKAMESLNKEQKDTVMMAFDMYIINDTKVDANRYIVNPPSVTVSAPFPRSMGGGTPDTKEMVEVADLTVVDGNIFWTIKQKYATNGRLQSVIRNTNRKIADSVTPVLNILSKGTGQAFEGLTDTIIFNKKEEEGDGVPDLLRRKGDKPAKK